MVVKVFVHNVGAYLGSNVAKALAYTPADGDEDAADDKVEVIGTLGSEGELKPRWVSRVVPATPTAMKDAFIECQMTVLDCVNAMPQAEAMLAEISQAGELEEEKVLVGISSVMTWNRTSPDPDEPEQPLTEAEFKRRRPHSHFKELLALEKLVGRQARDGLRVHVVAAGVTYGEGEDVFHPLFKQAWSNKPLHLHTLTDGNNLIPTIHVADLAAIVAALRTTTSAPPYLIAVDKGQQQETKPTLAAITDGIAKELGIGEVLPQSKEEVALLKDYEFLQAGVLLEATFAHDLEVEWRCEGGLLAHLPGVVQEFRQARGLNPLRLLILGNIPEPSHEFAKALAEEYKLPYVQASEAVAASRNGSDELADALRKVGQAATPPDLIAKAMSVALTTSECRNQGYILQGYPSNRDEAALLFPAKPADEAEGEEEQPEEEGEEGSPPPPASAVPPEFVLLSEAEKEPAKAWVLEHTPTKFTEEVLDRHLAEFADHNADDSPTSVLAAPAMAKVEPLRLRTDPTDLIDPIIAKARIYLGPPRNYGPSEEELAAAKAIADAEEANAKAEAKALAERQEEEEREHRERREALEARRLVELQQQERELLEVRSVPLRAYLMQNVIPTLTEGLIQVCKLKPEDPIDHLAEWLFKNNPVDDEHFD